MLVQGRGSKEHLDRFGPQGKYNALGVNDYVVVDFRESRDGQPTEVKAYEKKISVFFEAGGDFTSCVCRFGLDQADVLLELQT